MGQNQEAQKSTRPGLVLDRSLVYMLVKSDEYLVGLPDFLKRHYSNYGAAWTDAVFGALAS